MLVYGSIVAALLNIVLNYWLVPIYGFVAAGYTTLVSYIAFAISNYYNMRMVFKKRKLIDNLYDYKGLILILMIFVGSGFLGVALYGNLILRITITLLVLGVLIIYRDKYLNTLKQIRST